MVDRRILFFGDSFVSGVGDPGARGWVGRVAAASGPLTSYPLGVRGQTSAQVATRWVAEAELRLHPDADCRVVFSVGANDAVLGVAPEESEAHLGDCLEEAGRRGLPPLVVGPPPAGDAAQQQRIVALDAVFAGVCAEQGVPFVAAAEPLLADGTWPAQAAAGDGAHPGAEGYAVLAHLVLTGGWHDWLGIEAPPPIRLATARLLLRPTVPADVPVLRAQLATPEVAAWWGAESPGFPLGDEPDATRLTIVIEGGVAGLIQFGEETEPDYRHAWIDVYLDPGLHGHGLGTEAVRTLARWLIEERGHHRVTIDPATENVAAVRAYAKAGFSEVGVMRRSWRDMAGRWRDATLMEMLQTSSR